MKKNIFSFLVAMASVALLASCSEESGQEPGNDSTPRGTAFVKAADKPYNPDNDVLVRLAVNDKTTEAYYLYEKTSDYESHIAQMGNDGYADYIVQNGQKVDGISSANDKDIVITDLYGAYTIAIAAVNGGTKTVTTGKFTGLEWDNMATGTYTFGIMGSLLKPVETTLQRCTTDATLYRFKDLFGAGTHLKINLLPSYTAADEDGTYTFFRVAPQETGVEYGSNGPVSVRDIGYWQGNDAWVTDNGYESGMYEDYSCFVMCNWYIPGVGNIGYNNYDFFIPNN